MDLLSPGRAVAEQMISNHEVAVAESNSGKSQMNSISRTSESADGTHGEVESRDKVRAT